MFRFPIITPSPIAPVILTLGVLALNACSGSEGSAAAANPLMGVWSMTARTGDDGIMIDPSQSGVFIFTEGHYSAVYSIGADPRPEAAIAFTPTPDEMVAQYQTIIVNTGTYEVSGSTITYRPMIAKSAEFVGGSATMNYSLEGDILTLEDGTVVSAGGDSPPDLQSETLKLRRIE